MTTVFAPALQAWARDMLRHCGASDAAAEVSARLLTRTSLRGVDTHGIARLPAYAKNLRDGVFVGTARTEVVEHHGVLQCNGRGGLGQSVAMAAMEAAMDRAARQAIVTCTIRDTGHLGALGVIVLEAAERGFVAFLCQRTPPIMALEGFTGRAIGNNPLAFAMPVPGDVPLVFDMALSQVARGRVADAARDGLPAIPEGWAVDAQGQPTTDPQAALQGAMLPLAGAKGLGLAMLVQCFAGSLTGMAAEPPSAPLSAPAVSSSGGGTGAFLLVANPDLLVGRGAYDASVEEWLGGYRAAAGAVGRYPGERQARSEAQRLREGIPLSDGLARELQALAADCRLAWPPL